MEWLAGMKPTDRIFISRRGGHFYRAKTAAVPCIQQVIFFQYIHEGTFQRAAIRVHRISVDQLSCLREQQRPQCKFIVFNLQPINKPGEE